jgi:hypothetical protein
MYTVPVFDLCQKYIFIWPASNFRNSLKIDAEKVGKYFCTVMGGNGVFYHVNMSRLKYPKICFGFVKKVF